MNSLDKPFVEIYFQLIRCILLLIIWSGLVDTRDSSLTKFTFQNDDNDYENEKQWSSDSCANRNTNAWRLFTVCCVRCGYVCCGYVCCGYVRCGYVCCGYVCCGSIISHTDTVQSRRVIIRVDKVIRVLTFGTCSVRWAL